MCSSVSVASLDLLAVEEPFNLKVWIIDWFDSAFKVGPVTFFQILEAGQRGQEYRPLTWLLFFDSLWSFIPL